MNNMNLAQLESTLTAAARAHRPGDQVPYAFEKRVMAHIAGHAAADHWDIWSRALWRAAAPCVALSILLSAWSFLSPTYGSPGDLSQDLENAVLAAMEAESPAENLW